MLITADDVQKVILAYKRYSNYHFDDYSEKSFTRRVEKILIDYKLDIDGFVLKIKNDKDFMEQSVKDITVNTTELFRDPKIWQSIKYRVLPRYEEQENINIWHAGCSTGQEVYSMMILLHEMNLLDKANIYASDLNNDVLEVAKKGEYKYRFNMDYLENYNQVIKINPYNFDEYKDVPFDKYFDVDKTKDLMKAKNFLKQKPLFRRQDLVKQENVFYTKFDLILCRNVLIYFNYELQNRTLDFFHSMLFNKGSLILGVHESMLGPVAAKYIKKGVYYLKK
jgi:chemotaxis protein methyltransferase CheR